MGTPHGQFTLPPDDPTVVIHCDHSKNVFTVLGNNVLRAFRDMGEASEHALDIRGSAPIVLLNEFGDVIFSLPGTDVKGGHSRE